MRDQRVVIYYTRVVDWSSSLLSLSPCGRCDTQHVHARLVTHRDATKQQSPNSLVMCRPICLTCRRSSQARNFRPYVALRVYATLYSPNWQQTKRIYKHTNKKQYKQELGYRKQIARQLRTQYVEGIHTPKYYTVILKSRLRVTQGHWKRNHWTDHRRLTISQVI